MPDEMELRALRAEVALARGVPAAHAKRLVGNNRQELEADATALLAELGPGLGGGQGQQQQTPSFDQGRQGGTIPPNTTGQAGHAEAVRRFGAQAGNAYASGSDDGRREALEVQRQQWRRGEG